MESACAALFDRKELPLQIRLRCDWGVLRGGQVLTWSDEKLGWVTECGRWIMAAFAVRMRWGRVFEDANEEVQQSCVQYVPDQLLLAV
jgi:hypothetical protein